MPDTPHPDDDQFYGPVTEPLREVTERVAGLIANQRTPGTREVSNRSALVLAILCAVVFALGAVNVVIMAGQAHSAPSTDQQFAAQFNAITVHFQDTQPITAAQVPAVVAYACKPGNLDPVILPPAAWHQIQGLLASTARCPR